MIDDIGGKKTQMESNRDSTTNKDRGLDGIKEGRTDDTNGGCPRT